MTGSNITVDSSVWLSYFLTKGRDVADLLDSQDNLLFTSTLSLLEVKRRLIRLKLKGKMVDGAISLIMTNSILIQVSESLALASVDHCIEHGLHTVDAMIYETARATGSELATQDNDFRGLDGVLLLD